MNGAAASSQPMREIFVSRQYTPCETQASGGPPPTLTQRRRTRGHTFCDEQQPHVSSHSHPGSEGLENEWNRYW
eukprot:89885-Prymnesium_polylepis.1